MTKMGRREKSITLNQIQNQFGDVERLVEMFHIAQKAGLHRMKFANLVSDWNVDILRNLADALEDYGSEGFTLDDLQDYDGVALSDEA